MASTSRPTERFRPDVTLGGSVENLSLPQHDVKRDVQAEQKHHATLEATHVTNAAACVVAIHESEDLRTDSRRRISLVSIFVPWRGERRTKGTTKGQLEATQKQTKSTLSDNRLRIFLLGWLFRNGARYGRTTESQFGCQRSRLNGMRHDSMLPS